MVNVQISPSTHIRCALLLRCRRGKHSQKDQNPFILPQDPSPIHPNSTLLVLPLRALPPHLLPPLIIRQIRCIIRIGIPIDGDITPDLVGLFGTEESEIRFFKGSLDVYLDFGEVVTDLIDFGFAEMGESFFLRSEIVAFSTG